MKKFFIKICKFFGYEILDQNNFSSPTMGKELNEELSVLNEKSIVLPLGEVKITKKVKSILIILRMNTDIQIWDQNNVSLVDSAIRKSELGLNPQIDGQLIRLPIPELNEERRTELKKMIKSMGEKCKISIRNIRRDANEELKKLLKSKEIGEDEEKIFEKNVQTITDKHIEKVDEKVTIKEKEIMTI